MHIRSLEDYQEFQGVEILPKKSFIDERGEFIKLHEINDSTIIKEIKQINISVNHSKGTLRGMHYQKGAYVEDKSIFCLTGKLLDLIIDLRAESDTYMQAIAFELSSDTPYGVFIPKGFAHGFQTLLDNTTIIYLHSNDYKPDEQGRICPLSKELKKIWPLQVSSISQADFSAQKLVYGMSIL